MPIHIVAGALARVFEYPALLAAKGGRLHRTSGKLFVGAMIAMALTGAVIAAHESLASVSVAAGLLTFYLVTTALLTVRPRGPTTTHAASVAPAHQTPACRTGHVRESRVIPRAAEPCDDPRMPPTPWMHVESWLHDGRLALRGVLRARAFYLTAALTLAIGTSGATVMFALINGILLRPLPIPDEDSLVVSWRIPRSGLPTHVPYRSEDIEEIARGSQLFEQITGVGYNGTTEDTWRDGDAMIAVKTAAVMGAFFDVARVSAVLGRALTKEDDRVGAENVIVLSYAGWQRLFGGSRDVLGRSLTLQRHPFRIVGVMPADFEYPRGVEIWGTLHGFASVSTNEDFRAGMLRDVEMLARLRPGVTPDQAASELASVMTHLDRQALPGRVYRDFRPVVRPIKQLLVGDVDTALVVLFAAVGVILLIASANVANLLLMRGETRRSELVVRAALGASRTRLIRQLLIESLVVATVAGVLALVLSRWGLYVVTTLVPEGLPRASSVRVDTAVVVFTAGVAFLAAALSGLVPALAASRLDLVACLRDGGRGPIGSTRHRGRRLLVIAQVALAVTVVAAAGLLIRSFERLQSADMGLAHERIMFAELDLPNDRYADLTRRGQFLEALVSRVSVVPGVDGVTPINVLPFAGASGWELPRFTAEGQRAEQVADNPSLNFEAVHASYFATMQVPIVRGRAFLPSDREGAPRVAIVSDAVAAHTWPREDPIGKRVKLGGIASKSEWLTVVGVAATTRYRELATPRPTMYVPAEQFFVSASRLAIRSSVDVSTIARAVRDSVRSVDPGVEVSRVAPYVEYLKQPLAWPRFNALLIGVFAVAALLLSTIGFYGVMAASVRQRRAEIGVRVALGATARDVRRLVLGEGLRLAIAGAVIGFVLALATTRVLSGLLFEIQPLDPATLLAAAFGLVGAALLACFLPARRATRVDPVSLLRAH